MNVKKAEEYREIIKTLMRENNLIPLVGSGISKGARTEFGIVPDGAEYREEMLRTLKSNRSISNVDFEDLKNRSFSEIAGVYEDDEVVSADIRKKYLKMNFYNAKYSQDDKRRLFFDIDWPYIYSLNIDDVIEKSTRYKNVIMPNRRITDDFIVENLCVMKLHGDIGDLVKYNDSYKVFSQKEYINSLFERNMMLYRMASDYGSVSFVIIGCSLEDEVDIIALNAINNFMLSENTRDDISGSVTLNNQFKSNYLFSIKEPSLIEKSRLKNFNITDVILFDTYDDMYLFLYGIWKEVRNENASNLDAYSGFEIKGLSSKDKDNVDYFYMAINPVDYLNNRIICPYYMIERDGVSKVLSDVNKHIIQILSGSRFSGKTYFLVSLFLRISDRNRFFFDSRNRIPDSTLMELLNKKNSVLIFDTDCLSRSQMGLILDHSDAIHDNAISVIIMVHTTDSEIYDLIEVNKEKGYLKATAYTIYKDIIYNKLSDKEFEDLNKKLVSLRIKPQEKGDTIINHLLITADLIQERSKYSSIRITEKKVVDIAFYIALASFDSLRYSDIINFGFVQNADRITRRTSPIIEKMGTKRYERNNGDMSGMKYVINSKHWIRREFTHMTNNCKCYDTIVSAYRYLVERIVRYKKTDRQKYNRELKRIIYFESINSLFGEKSNGKRALVAKIYMNLEDLIGEDYQYNHQRAKCLMTNAIYQKNSREKEMSYSDALSSAQIALTQIDNEYKKTSNEKLLISRAHVEYTYASVEASICELNNYTDVEQIERTIKNSYYAVINPYNKEDFRRDKNRKMKYGIIRFTKVIMNMNVLNEMSDIAKNLYNDLLRLIVTD